MSAWISSRSSGVIHVWWRAARHSWVILSASSSRSEIRLRQGRGVVEPVEHLQEELARCDALPRVVGQRVEEDRVPG